MHVHVHVHIHIHIHIHVHVYVYICMYTCVSCVPFLSLTLSILIVQSPVYGRSVQVHCVHIHVHVMLFFQAGVATCRS